MKNQLTKFLFILIAIAISKFAYDKYQTSKNSHFTVTADTVIKPGSEISKYVTQEEVDSFALRYWDIDEDAKYSNDNIDENITQKTLRSYLKVKDTNSLLNFIKDNNLSVDTRMMYNLTPLMYSSFYDDEVTSKELLNLGANPNLKDSYNLSPLAYAIENNSTKTFKLLLNNGAIFDEDMIVQNYLTIPCYASPENHCGINKIIVYGDNMDIIYNVNYGDRQDKGRDSTTALSYIVDLGFAEILEMVFDSGYEVKSPIIQNCTKYYGNDKFKCSYYSLLVSTPIYKKPLNILLDNNISMPVDDEFLKSEYEKCYRVYKSELNWLENEIRSIEEGEAEYDVELELKKRNNLDIFDSEIYKNNYLNLYPREANTKTISFKKKDLYIYKSFCSDTNSIFKSIKEYIYYKNWRNKTIELNRFINRYPEKVYLKDKNMTLKEFQDIEYEKYLNENRGKNGKKLK